tara:strand:- start:254 stop:472 length:219 start_codon:yes stop_codon:yes gene_type:complete
MNNEKKILDYISNKYKIKASSNTKIFNEIDIDSFEFVKIINELEKKLKKKYKPTIFDDFSKINLKKFSKLFV